MYKMRMISSAWDSVSAYFIRALDTYSDNIVHTMMPELVNRRDEFRQERPSVQTSENISLSG